MSAWEFEDYGHTGRVEITGDEVVVTKPSGKPAVRRCSLAEAFRNPWGIFVWDTGVLQELVVALAARLPEADLEDPVDHKRLRWWRHLDPLALEDRCFPVPPRGSRGAYVYELVGGVFLHPYPADPGEPEPGLFRLADDVFFYGPEAVGLARETRVELRRHLLAAVADEAGLGEDDGFPLIDYSRVPRRSWTWDVNAEGQSDGVLQGPFFSSGYQYRHDMGSSTFSVERALTGPPGQYLHAPGDVLREAREVLRGAVEG